MSVNYVKFCIDPNSASDELPEPGRTLDPKKTEGVRAHISRRNRPPWSVRISSYRREIPDEQEYVKSSMNLVYGLSD